MVPPQPRSGPGKERRSLRTAGARFKWGKNCILREARRIDNAIKHFYDHLEDGPSG
jgi:hypothetical protein